MFYLILGVQTLGADKIICKVDCALTENGKVKVGAFNCLLKKVTHMQIIIIYMHIGDSAYVC